MRLDSLDVNRANAQVKGHVDTVGRGRVVRGLVAIAYRLESIGWNVDVDHTSLRRVDVSPDVGGHDHDKLPGARMHVGNHLTGARRKVDRRLPRAVVDRELLNHQ